jgi:hypothetical protein
MAWIEKSGQHYWRVRYRHADGSTGSVAGFRTEKTARDYAADMNTDQRRGTWIDPAAGRTALTAWVERWLPSLDLDERTIEGYGSRLRCHILPHFGTTALGDITTLDVALWAKPSPLATHRPPCPA